MICPRCAVGRLEGSGSECAVCGYVPPRTTDIALSVAHELEQQARRELDKDFEILRMIGRGGMSVVYLAQERELGREVALKLLPLHLAMGDDAPDRFKREARIAAGLDHPHIVPVHRVGATPRFLWYTMKYVRGRSLGEILAEQGPLPLEETVRIIAEVASALNYAHQRGVVHRDVKPGNIMLDASGWAWVGDFGVAKAFGTLPLTQTGGALGTPAYMSPEQCYGKQLDGRADQYGLAIVVYECLTGAPPFTADSMGEYVRLHCTVPPPDVAERRDDLPPEVVEALERALAKDPEYRFASILDFAAALGADVSRPPTIPLASSAGHDPGLPPATPTTPHPWVSPITRGGRPPLRRVGMLAALGAVAATALMLVPGGAPPTPEQSPPQSAVTAPAGRPDNGPAEPPAAEREARFVYLVISTVPLGRLYVDGEYVGESFATADDPYLLTPGVHEIRVERDGRVPYVERIEAAAGQVVQKRGIQLQPTGS